MKALRTLFLLPAFLLVVSCASTGSVKQIDTKTDAMFKKLDEIQKKVDKIEEQLKAKK